MTVATLPAAHNSPALAAKPRHQRRTPAASRDQRGNSASVLVLLCVLALIVMAGLVTDGARLSSARQQAQTAAQQAARSAADAGATGRIGGQPDAYRARAAAQDHLRQAGVAGEVTIRPDGTVLVRTTVTTPTQLLGIIGINELTGHGEAVADLRVRPG
ncbi:pilus assembly protein TadG-related protein [Parenemella sanctibonifatiensis]|uniref:Putative Flp pilus-assembly TadG-like N-terminal domain-containing protein n=1 Tax=Parenemella sanctibonifatiensis TaxID=2016505 RepID=A0A255ENL2_9ACTN|nr:pilus assembly protein TadG-related protein [Parenemella sanctibonifatiensis]OYN91185.1 hypothetical protein CGZ91_06940 [Parenemella sanctibonifatiensis]